MSNLLKTGILGGRGVTGHALSSPALAKEVKITKLFWGQRIFGSLKAFLAEVFQPYYPCCGCTCSALLRAEVRHPLWSMETQGCNQVPKHGHL